MRVAFLWHMHQPLYLDPVTEQPILPWVRLHATRAYFDMAWLLERHEPIRCTVNFATVLLEQIDRFVEGLEDRFLQLSLRPPAELTEADRQFILRNFFMVNWDHNVKPLPRYWELLEKRGRDLRQVNLKVVARQFSDAELGDLQLLFNLAWMGFAAQTEHEGLRALRDKGRDFTREDMAYVAATQREILRQIVPRYRKLSERGQVELSATPYYHPILPLVCDTDAAQRAMPQVVLPKRFSYPDDARWHVRAAADGHAQRFGAKPRGMWPAEGSVSPEALEILASEGLQWAATDEAVLLRSLSGQPARADVIYRPWIAQAGDREIRMLFRDRELSDLIGFTYSQNRADAAVDDLIARLHAIAKAKGPHAPAERTVGIFLDGENPWESFTNSGRDFLETLYRRMEKDPQLRTATMTEATSGAADRIDRIHSGSWIEGSYRIWIGHAEDRAGWNALGYARAALEQARGKIEEARWDKAKRHLLIAEGSDWFWWYGDDFVTETAADFDALFRGHVLEACRLLEVAPPPEARDAIKRLGESATGMHRSPRSLISPTIDGRETHYFEWQGAGYFQADASRGSMFGGEQLAEGVHFGFDLRQLYLRVDLAQTPTSPPTQLRLGMLDGRGAQTVSFAISKGASVVGAGSRGSAGQCVAGARGDIIELSLSFKDLGVSAGDKLSVSVELLRGEVEVERLPRFGYFTVEIPDESFERIHWRA